MNRFRRNVCVALWRLNRHWYRYRCLKRYLYATESSSLDRNKYHPTQKLSCFLINQSNKNILIRSLDTNLEEQLIHTRVSHLISCVTWHNVRCNIKIIIFYCCSYRFNKWLLTFLPDINNWLDCYKYKTHPNMLLKFINKYLLKMYRSTDIIHIIHFYLNTKFKFECYN